MLLLLLLLKDRSCPDFFEKVPGVLPLLLLLLLILIIHSIIIITFVVVVVVYLLLLFLWLTYDRLFHSSNIFLRVVQRTAPEFHHLNFV